MENRKVKESIKVALSFVITYAVSLNYNWFDPAWAGFGIAMVAMPNFKMEQSFKKASLRMVGTIVGSIVGLIIMGIAPQSRFLFMFLCAAWIFITMYMMAADKNHSYMWNVLGFTCLIITTAGTSNSVDAFDHALYRILENVLGVGIYTLVSFLIWPNHEKRNVKSVSIQLFTFFKEDILSLKKYALGDSFDVAKAKKELLSKREELEDIFSLNDFNNKDKKQQNNWKNIAFEYDKSYNSLVRLMITIEELKNTSFNDFVLFTTTFSAVDLKLDNIIKSIKGEKIIDQVTIDLPKLNQGRYSSFEANLLQTAIDELSQIKNALMKINNALEALTSEKEIKASHVNSQFKLNIPIDRDYFISALYASLCVLGGFLIWILIDPPGHNQWYMSSGANAMFIAMTPQLKGKTLMKYFTIMSIYTTLIYTFIMPQLGSYYALGSFLFLYVFVQYYFLEGFAFVTAAFGLMLMGFTNEGQSYSFAQIINTDLFNVISMFLLIGLAYMLNSTRPEKAYMNKINQFFESTQFLIRNINKSVHPLNFYHRLKITLAKRDLQTIPLSLEKWLAVVDFKLYSGVTTEQLEEVNFLVQRAAKRVQVIIDRMETSEVPQEIRNQYFDLKDKTLSLITLFENRDEEEVTLLKSHVISLTNDVEKGNDSNNKTATFNLLRNYHLLLNILEDYKKISNHINWSLLKEERFA